jgi:hypothetical protein
MKGQKVLIAFVALITITGFAMPVMGAVVTVDKDGTGDYNSVQKAVNSASAGDTIELEGGETYYESIDLTADNLNFTSSNNQTVEIVAYKSNGTQAIDFSSDGGTSTVNVGDNVRLVNKSVVTVNASDSNNYNNISEAINDTTHGTVVNIVPDTYNESVNITSDYVILQSTNTSENVTIDATNTTSGDAVVENGNGIIVRDSVKTINGVLGSGGGSIGLNDKVGGIPKFVWLIVAGVGAFILWNRME